MADYAEMFTNGLLASLESEFIGDMIIWDYAWGYGVEMYRV